MFLIFLIYWDFIITFIIITLEFNKSTGTWWAILRKNGTFSLYCIFVQLYWALHFFSDVGWSAFIQPCKWDSYLQLNTCQRSYPLISLDRGEIWANCFVGQPLRGNIVMTLITVLAIVCMKITFFSLIIRYSGFLTPTQGK